MCVFTTRSTAVARSFVVILFVGLFAPSSHIPRIFGQGNHDVEPGHVLLVRGVLTVFSLGLDDLAEQLKAEGLNAHVTPASMAFGTAEGLAQQYANGQAHGPLVLIGHSLGADILPLLAKQFAHHRVPIDLMVMIDSTNPTQPPPNVRRCVNLYQSNSSPSWFRIFRGAPINTYNQSTELVNIDIRDLPEQEEAAGLNHFNIDSSAWVQHMVVRVVLPEFRSSKETPVAINIDHDEGVKLQTSAPASGGRTTCTCPRCCPPCCRTCCPPPQRCVRTCRE